MNRIGIVAALPAELRPLTRGWQQRDGIFLGRIGDTEAVAACAGMGADAATSACVRLVAAYPVDALISIGFAGSLSCGLRPPEACVIREVIDAATGQRFPGAHTQGQRLITLDHVADATEKRRLAETFQSVLVDMEAAAVARFACTQNLGFLCLKAVTDGPGDKLPDFNRFTSTDGQLRLPAFLLHALLHPQTWSPLRRLAQNSRLAAQELASALPRCLADSQ